MQTVFGDAANAVKGTPEVVMFVPKVRIVLACRIHRK